MLNSVLRIGCRRFKSLIFSTMAYVFSFFRQIFILFFQGGVFFGRGVKISEGVRIKCTDDGRIDIGDFVAIGRGVEIICMGGWLVIGPDVYIGPGCVIVCRDKVIIGRDSQIAEYCVVRDQDHALTSRPIRGAGFETSPIVIGDDCWLGAKVTVLRGSTIGPGAVIGAHALVRGQIEPLSLAVGCPARLVKFLDRQQPEETK
jgi:acetyltransferase-like isoleucine patch superfamily enzyme